jgi:hypothetical protein
LTIRDITTLLKAWSAGDCTARDQLMPLVYYELKRLARRCMRKERTEATLQTTALVHEAYLRLVGLNQIGWRDRAHFFAWAQKRCDAFWSMLLGREHPQTVVARLDGHPHSRPFSISKT